MGRTVDPELVAKRRRRAAESRKRMAARGINLAKWDNAKRQQQDKDRGA